MYHDPKLEIKLSRVIKRSRIEVPIYRIGAARDGYKKTVLVQFGVKNNISRAELSRNAVEILYSVFLADGDIQQVDLYGTDLPDTKTRKGNVLFSVSAKREDFHRLDLALSSERALTVFGMIYYSSNISDKRVNWVKVIKEHYKKQKPAKKK